MMLKRNGLILAATLLAGTASAEVTHTSKATNLKIPKGSFTQFRLSGEGLNDDNLRADITQTMHSITVEGVPADSHYGKMYADSFDVFIFTREEDYNCYIEASTIWVEHMQAKTCDFLSDDSVVKP